MAGACLWFHLVFIKKKKKKEERKKKRKKIEKQKSQRNIPRVIWLSFHMSARERRNADEQKELPR